ncbi:methylmalonyl Co-A mutase-associated GTPase MeaB [Hyunsoonleella pacifica]|uniref:Methylmalonyl Co-A mutase-associated GTPase MeaB n=1 Tax=Hyunsoonleella pacifica TaxID=1080224 RepID=A0A4Q9FJN1_9FLAO|nr:methylmalonyl Co-A mutase-associated GTPase MeaB [Hyunsoonleella pacifica]TBN13773.1 methylmalonyl Co-A mutase-associated GTPase MeaB [Hyunsoonleella pacifica]GGD25556.1 ATPase/protein kinase [Hyunsoonleella pacifica]
MANRKKTALKQTVGVSNFETVNTTSTSKFKSKRTKLLDSDKLVKSILNRNTTDLSRAITLIESTNPKHQEQANTILKQCLPHSNKSIRIGITGVPGVGKSTFIEALGKYLTKQGKHVAVLAIDPSSSVTKGSILGDKTRMSSLVKDKNAYIRPSASGDSLGGVARKTRETIILCEAAGFDIILIETVGVGQSETVVHSMVDFFLLLKLAGAGDELQGIKRGIIEMADAIAINKTDGDNKKAANLAKVEFSKALHLYPQKVSGWTPKVALCSALHNEGITSIWQLVSDYIELTKSNTYFDKKRNEQNKYWLIQTIENRLKSDFFGKEDVKTALKNQLRLIENNEVTPFAAAELILNLNKSL